MHRGGEKRVAPTIARTTHLTTAPAEPRHSTTGATTGERVRQPGIRLRYLGSGPKTLTGPRSGRTYWWGTAAASTVALADVDALLGTGLFAIDGEPAEPPEPPAESDD